MSQVDAAAETALGRLFAKYGLPLVGAAIGFLILRGINGIDQRQVEQAEAQAKQSQQISEVRSDVRDLNTRLDLTVIQQVQDLKQRVQSLEQARGVP